MYAHTAQEAGQSLLVIISDILDYAKIEAGKLELEMSDFDPARVARRGTGGAWAMAARIVSTSALRLLRSVAEKFSASRNADFASASSPACRSARPSRAFPCRTRRFSGETGAWR